ncbi:MAG: hypothetical protein IJF92_05835 [Bacilli bacterium]|nr:hypothetical protein [Bacilli bacterium]
MNSRILFMIIDNQVMYLENSNMDHKEWYESLNLNIEDFDNVVRGFIMNNMIIFYKGFFNYDNETIRMAEKFYPDIKKSLNNPNLEVYCGIVPGKPGQKWEPILKIDGKTNLNNRFTNDTKINKNNSNNIKTSKKLEPIIDFKNNYNDSKVLKNAKIMTIIVLIIDVLLKIILYSRGSLSGGLFDTIIVFTQFVLLIVSIVGYTKGINKTYILSFIASICIILSFNILDIVLGLIYFTYTIDQSFINKFILKIKNRLKVNQK